MANDGQDQDRSEKATPSRLREARRQGQVAKSTELTAWLVMLAGTAAFYLFGSQLLAEGMQLSRALFDQSGGFRLSPHTSVRLYAETLLQLFGSFGFLAAAVLGAGLLANFAQTGPVFSWKPLQADFKRINPAAGFKRLFNKKILFELAKTSLKLAIVGGVVIAFIRQRGELLAGLLHMEIGTLAVVLLQEILALAFWLLGALAIIALLDFAFSRWDYARNLRMSRRDIKDEHKRQEGDPLIKAKIRELQREAARRGGSIGRVADADVLITNPTHLSIALRYRHGETPAPIVVAKGAGELALTLRLLANRHRVPVVEHKPLARQLFRRVGIDEAILPECYGAVAAILTRINQQRGAQQ